MLHFLGWAALCVFIAQRIVDYSNSVKDRRAVQRYMALRYPPQP